MATKKAQTKKATTNKAAAKKAPEKKAATSKSTSSSESQSVVAADPDAATGLREFMVESLKDIYWAEKALTKAIPKMAKNATSENLRKGLNTHLEETKGQVTRLEEAFQMLGKKAQAKKCEAMEGLIKEANSIMSETKKGMVRDAGIIAAAQKIEHYEIATYGTLCAFAKALGENDLAQKLHKSLEEEKNADQTLTNAAYNDINVQAIT